MTLTKEEIYELVRIKNKNAENFCGESCGVCVLNRVKMIDGQYDYKCLLRDILWPQPHSETWSEAARKVLKSFIFENK